jgi:S-adenosylmethionine hydrolase
VQLRFSSPTDLAGTSTRSAVRATSFAELGAGAVGLVLDSYGMLAIALDQRSAADELGLAPGDQVVLVDLGEPTAASTPVELGRRPGGAR